MGGGEAAPGVMSAAHRFDVRAYHVTNEQLHGKTVVELEEYVKETRTSIERIRHGGQIIDAEPASVVHKGDVIAIVGRRNVLVESDLGIGPEIHDVGARVSVPLALRREPHQAQRAPERGRLCPLPSAHPQASSGKFLEIFRTRTTHPL